MTTDTEDERLDLVFTALADRTRRAILTQLANGEANPGELAKPFAISQQAISKHIKILERAGLVSQTRISRSRPCRLQTEPLVSAVSWVEENRALWQTRHDQLEQHLRNLAHE